MDNLEKELGLVSISIPNYKVIKVDNGDNKAGKNATGEFVYKYKDDAGNYNREQYGKKLGAIILLSRARLMSKYDPKATMPWWTPEFNPTNVIEKIKIFIGKEQRAEYFYKEMKHSSKFTILQQDGSRKNNFSYITVLYVLIEGKILKLELTGRSQGNWFDYSSKTSKSDKSLLKHQTNLSVVESKDDKGDDTGSYECKFTLGEKVENEEEIRNRAITLLEAVGTTKALPQAETQQALPAKEEIPLPKEPGEEVIQIEEELVEAKPVKEETNEDVEEIKIEDIPF